MDKKVTYEDIFQRAGEIKARADFLETMPVAKSKIFGDIVGETRIFTLLVTHVASSTFSYKTLLEQLDACQFGERSKSDEIYIRVIEPIEKLGYPISEYNYDTLDSLLSQAAERKKLETGQYCEVPSQDADLMPNGRICEHKGIMDICQLHKEETPEDYNGWIRCCVSCTTPHFEKKEN